MLALTDFSLIGTVLAVTLAIITLAGIALYVAFRVRETLREEKGKGARIAKIGIMIGLLFLAGGLFFFFGIGLSHTGSTQTNFTTVVITTVTATPTVHASSSSVTSTFSTSAVGSSSSTSRTSTASSGAPPTTGASQTSDTTSASGTSTSTANVTMQLSYPTRVKASSTFTFSFTINNSGGATANSATIRLGSLLGTFTLVSSTNSVSGGVVNVGNLPPGTTVVSLTIKAPSRPGQFSGPVELDFQGMSSPLSASITIQTTG